MFINDVDKVPVDVGYKGQIEEIMGKLRESKVNLIKNFSINVLLLDDSRIQRAPENILFINYLFELSKICLGFFYNVHNAEELGKSVSLFCASMNQFSLLNVKLLVKGNLDPSIIIDAYNYPAKESVHNNYEIFVGNLLT